MPLKKIKEQTNKMKDIKTTRSGKVFSPRKYPPQEHQPIIETNKYDEDKYEGTILFFPDEEKNKPTTVTQKHTPYLQKQSLALSEQDKKQPPTSLKEKVSGDDNQLQQIITSTTSPTPDKVVNEDDNSLPPIVTQIRKNMEKHQVYVKHKLGKKPYASIEEKDDASYEDSMDEELYDEDMEHQESLINDKVKENIKELEKLLEEEKL
jgi:hypothetical protein